MFKKVTIPYESPRAAKDLGKSIKGDFSLKKFFVYFFITGSILLMAIVLINLKAFISNVHAAIILAIMATIFTVALKKIKSIRSCESLNHTIYEKGSPVVFNVTEQKRRFSWYKSSRDYEITAKCKETGKSINIKSTSVKLWQSHPVASNINGLEFEGNYFFGATLGLQFAFEK